MTRREACDTIVLIVVGVVIGLAVVATGLGFWAMLPTKASAAEAWPLNPTGNEHISAWFQSLMQPDNTYMSCCGRADAFEADTFEVDGDHYVAIITDGFGVYPSGTRIPVPNKKMKWDAGNPTGHGVLFLQVGTMNVYCFVAPGGV